MVSGNVSYKYSKQSREVYVQKDGRLYLVKSRSSFTGIFEKAYRKEINEFLRLEKISFREASEKKLVELMDFCTRLIHSG